MIPRIALDLDPTVPAVYRPWTPRGEDLSDGLGFFHDTWLIRGVRVRDARDLLEYEAERTAIADRLTTTAEEFDHVATAIEEGDPEELPLELQTNDVLGELELDRLDAVQYFGGLELGVAGIVCALSAVGCWTAASCRGHPAGWSDRPVVFLTADSHRIGVLQPLVAESGCGFEIDENRPELLMVQAASIAAMASLASRVLDDRASFPRRRGPRKRRTGGITGTQDQLPGMS